MTKLPTGYTLTDDQAAIDAVAAHAYLTQSYWSPGIQIDTVRRAIAGSYCVAIQWSGAQVAFGRIISDFATFAWLADVYVLEAHQGRGLARAMLDHFHSYPRLQGLRRWGLVTVDAHSVYERAGWSPIAHPVHFMERYFPQLEQHD